jgi:hypothetical protein
VQGSFYTSTQQLPNWEDFTAGELVEYIDKNIVLFKQERRGLAGFSNGRIWRN